MHKKETTELTVRAVLYARVCVEDGQNLEEQLENCRQQAQARDWSIIEELAEQGAGIGSSVLPQLGHVLDLARDNKFDVLVVHDPFRLSRELSRLLSLEAQLARDGIRIEYGCPEMRGACQCPARHWQSAC